MSNKKYSEGSNIPYPTAGAWSDYIELGFVPDKIVILAEQTSNQSNFMGIYEDGHFYVNAYCYSYIHDFYDDGSIEVDGSKFRINGFSSNLNGGTFSYIAVADIPVLPPLPTSKLIFDGKVYGSVIYGGDDMIDYSTEEQKTGQKWIDGKDIYQKTVIGNDIVNDQLILGNVDTLINVEGCIMDYTYNARFLLNFKDSANATISVNQTSSNVYFTKMGQNLGKAYNITLIYTKTE